MIKIHQRNVQKRKKIAYANDDLKVLILIVSGILLIYYLCNSFGPAVCFKLLLALQNYIVYPRRDILSALVSMAV